MAKTALNDEEAKEYFDTPDELQRKIKVLADLIRNSNHFVAFTGAGISTAAGIADFRSGRNTVLDTGAGAWTRKAAAQKGQSVKKAKRKVSTLKAYPTAAHMALVGLMRAGDLKYLISQNTDGLHRRSGIPTEQLSELHGNGTLEKCDKCGKEYARDYYVKQRAARKEARRTLTKEEKKGRWKHRTGRVCTVKDCLGPLCDTVIAFGEHLPFDPLAIAQQQSSKADLYLSLGSSLAVTPACDMPKDIGKKWLKQKKAKGAITHNLVIVNLQKTPLHKKSSLAIFAKIDDVMIGVMKELEIEIPKWYLQRFLKIDVVIDPKVANERRLIIAAVDADGTNFDVFKGRRLKYNGKVLKRTKINAFELEYIVSRWNGELQEMKLELEFYGNYNEPMFEFPLNEFIHDLMVTGGGDIMLRLRFDPIAKTWGKPSKWAVHDSLDLSNICLMKLYKTSYGYDGKNAILFANDKRKDCLPLPERMTQYITSDKHTVAWMDGKTGKEDLTSYTDYYHHLGLFFCYFYDYYVPHIKIKALKRLLTELYGDHGTDEEILCLICEYEGMCKIFNDFLVGDYFNPPPFYQTLILNKMFANLDSFPAEWKKFINKYSQHRRVTK